MYLQGLLAVLSVAGCTSALHVRAEDPGPSSSAQNGTEIEAKKFIVELAPDVNLQDLTGRIDGKIIKTFDSDVFRGVSVESDTENLDTLHAKSFVYQAWPSKKFQLQPVNPTSLLDVPPVQNYSIHQFTGVDKVHAAGYYGKGAVVAIVDTGTQYTHPALGGGFGPGYKVAGGWDFIGDQPWPGRGLDKHPDSDPMDQSGHGTHVAGIVAGKSDEFTGVAPEATLMSYKVFSTLDSTDEDTLLEAFLRAYDDGADVITCSVGAASGWGTDAWATVGNRLVEQGVVITVAAGNDGLFGGFMTNSGAASENVLAVASIEAAEVAEPMFVVTASLQNTTNVTSIPFMSGYSTDGMDNLKIRPLNVSMDTCQPLPADTPDLSDGIILVRRAACGFGNQESILEEFNATRILFYNNDQPLTTPGGNLFDPTWLGLIDAEYGEAIIEIVNGGGSVVANFSTVPPYSYSGLGNGLGNLPNYFTSLGPTFDLTIKPDIAAPGGDILSTYPTNQYATLSGTSMATPYVAGVAALWIGKNGGRKVHGPGFAKDLVMRIIASGESVKWNVFRLPNNAFWAPVVQVGTGLVNASKVLDYTTSLSFAKFALNDTHHFSRYHSVDITNNGKTDVTYQFSLQDAAGFESWQPPIANRIYDTPAFKRIETLIPVQMVPNISFPRGTFKVRAGETKTAQFSFLYPNYPDGLQNVPMYSGKVLVTGDNGEVLAVPYFGVASNVKEEINVEFTDHEHGPIPWMVSGSVNYPITIDKHNTFTFNLSLAAQDFPRVFSATFWGTQELRWDIFEADWKERQWTYPPVVGKNGYVGTVAVWTNDWNRFVFDPAIDDVNDLYTFPLTNIPRCGLFQSPPIYYWLGKLANGTHIAPGNYSMRFAALAPFGTPEHSNNWDTRLYPFSVVPLN